EEPDREEQLLRHHGRRLLRGGGGITVRLLVESSASRVRPGRQHVRVERLQEQRNRSDAVRWPGAVRGGRDVPDVRYGSRELLREQQVRYVRGAAFAAPDGAELQVAHHGPGCGSPRYATPPAVGSVGLRGQSRITCAADTGRTRSGSDRGASRA